MVSPSATSSRRVNSASVMWIRFFFVLHRSSFFEFVCIFYHSNCPLSPNIYAKKQHNLQWVRRCPLDNAHPPCYNQVRSALSQGTVFMEEILICERLTTPRRWRRGIAAMAHSNWICTYAVCTMFATIIRQ